METLFWEPWPSVNRILGGMKTQQDDKDRRKQCSRKALLLTPLLGKSSSFTVLRLFSSPNLPPKAIFKSIKQKLLKEAKSSTMSSEAYSTYKQTSFNFSFTLIESGNNTVIMNLALPPDTEIWCQVTEWFQYQGWIIILIIHFK